LKEKNRYVLFFLAYKPKHTQHDNVLGASYQVTKLKCISFYDQLLLAIELVKVY